ncbi:general odorant-binding protein 56h-like [Anastrepha ludens]|uniref:general odorant-binding protein 56h-like n=1 Tax=Anastrepha ludens TaxID=28586 RepID=UPI0023AE90FB|nr:general odorant-binding protein 56h-like [Anastrepha ludens]
MNSFITVALILVFSATTLCQPHDPEMRKIVEECNKEHNVSPKDFHEFMEGKLATPSNDLKCSMQCAMVKQGIMNESGTFNADAAKAKMPSDAKLASAIDACKNEAGSSPCDTAAKITQCLMAHK